MRTAAALFVFGLELEEEGSLISRGCVGPGVEFLMRAAANSISLALGARHRGWCALGICVLW